MIFVQFLQKLISNLWIKQGFSNAKSNNIDIFIKTRREPFFPNLMLSVYNLS